MNSIKDLYAQLPINVVIDYHIQNDPCINALESKIHEGDLSVITEIESRVDEIINNEIEDFDGKELFESSYLKRIKMLVKTKQILAS